VAHANAPLTPEGRRRLNYYNHDRPHSAIGNRPPVSRAPDAGPRLTHEPIVLPLDRAGQISLDLGQ